MDLSELATQLMAVPNLKSDVAERDAEITKLRKQLAHAKRAVKNLEFKVGLLEQNYDGIDPVDEQWFWDNQVEIKFSRRLDGTKRLYIKPQGGARLYGETLKEIVSKASARTRRGQEQQADT